MNKVLLWGVGVAVLIVAGFWYTSRDVQAPTDTPQTSFNKPVATTTTVTTKVPERQSYKDLVKLNKPKQNELLVSPLTITGEARGTWYFEASFPVVLTNWDGLIIAEGHAEAQSDWMTEEYVPFKATLTFVSPYKVGDQDFMKKGSLILKKDNPSGLPENDDAFETTVTFAPAKI